MGCNTHTIWDGDPHCTECGYVWKGSLPAGEPMPIPWSWWPTIWRLRLLQRVGWYRLVDRVRG